MKQFGAKHGLGSFADAITRGSDGRFHTANTADRSAILALRNDPTVASLMEGEYAQASRATLQGALGRDVCGGELYMAHFLGDSEACRMIRMVETQPTASAAATFPTAAERQPAGVLSFDGTAKTVKEVYDWALRAPNATAALHGTACKARSGAEARPVCRAYRRGRRTTNTDALLMSIATWRPSHGFFSNDTSDGGQHVVAVVGVVVVVDHGCPAVGAVCPGYRRQGLVLSVLLRRALSTISTVTGIHARRRRLGLSRHHRDLLHPGRQRAADQPAECRAR